MNPSGGDELLYLLRLHRFFGSSSRGKKLLGCYGSAKKAFEALESGECLFVKDASRISATGSFTLEDAAKAVSDCEKEGWEIVAYPDEAYPALLRETDNPPVVLFVRGDVSALAKRPKAAVVGTRNPTDPGRATAYKAGLYLSLSGVTVVSGGAPGIDSAAHEGALLGLCPTVSVLACGPGQSYERHTGRLHDKIVSGGCFVTEQFPYQRPSRFSFPKRNRIITGLSDAVFVAEAGEKSGALVSADAAVKQGRPICVPGAPALVSPGCEKLLREGAKAVNTAGDIVSLFRPEAAAGCGGDYLSLPLESGSLGGRIFLRPDLSDDGQYGAYATVDENEQSEIEKDRRQKKSKTPAKEKPQSRSDVSVPSPGPLKAPDCLSPEASAVFGALGPDPVFMDDIAAKTGLGIEHIMAAVTELEIYSLAVMYPGNMIAKA